MNNIERAKRINVYNCCWCGDNHGHLDEFLTDTGKRAVFCPETKRIIFVEEI